MRCHYEVLGVPRDVSDDELKKSYRKLALKWHPDKNLDNMEDAKEQFQLVQQAWEVLSDPHERAWYDNHREAILKGGIGDNYKDDSIDLFQYFTSSCYKGYGDDENGFYMVYKKVFEQLVAEDSEFSKEEDDEEIPHFGDSTSPYESVVHNFYAYWQSYSTKRSFAWLDPYDIRDTPNRRVLRLVEKENKKVRDKARKERNEQVRNLVAFVRKRDKRVQLHAQKLAERSKENTRKAQERKKQQALQRQQEMKDYTESEWSKFSNIEKELKLIEANLAAEFGEELTSDGDTNEEDDFDNNTMYCVACNKIFKTQRAFTNHEKSKKHKDNILAMKLSMQKEDDEFESGADDPDSDADSDSDIDPAPNSCKSQMEGIGLATGPEIPDFILYHHAETSKKTASDQSDTSDEELISDYESNSKKQKNKRYLQKKQGTKLSTGPEMEDFSMTKPNVPDVRSNEESLTSEGELISDQDSEPEKLVQKSRKKKKKGKKVRKVVLDITTEDEAEGNSISLKVDDEIDKGNREGDLDHVSSNMEDSVKDVKVDSNEDAGIDSIGTNINGISKKSKGKKSKEARKTQKVVVLNEHKTKSKKGKRHSNQATSDTEQVDLTSCCMVCKSEFPTKNKLFDHLKKTGHMTYIPNVTKVKKDAEKSGKIKKKSSKGSD